MQVRERWEHLVFVVLGRHEGLPDECQLGAGQASTRFGLPEPLNCMV